MNSYGIFVNLIAKSALKTPFVMKLSATWIEI